MKIAIVHDKLSEFGGAERVLQSLLELYPFASVYTGYVNSRIVHDYFPKLSTQKIHSSWANKTFIVSHSSLFQVFSSFIWKSFNFEKYDIVISSSSHLLSNLIRVNKPVHIQYIHSPPKNIFLLQPPTPLQRFCGYTEYIAAAYKHAILSSRHLLVNSHHIQKMIYEIVGVQPDVIYPPVYMPALPRRRQGDYFICVSRIDEAKHLELAISACSQLRLSLKIVGTANNLRYERFLRSIAGPTITFEGKKSDKEISNLYECAKAFIFCSPNEDFGIAPVEAMAHGVPVIGYYGGGLKETVVEGETGHFFYEHSKEAVVRAIRTFDPNRFSVNSLCQHAAKFSEKKFKNNIKRYINTALSEKMK